MKINGSIINIPKSNFFQLKIDLREREAGGRNVENQASRIDRILWNAKLILQMLHQHKMPEALS